MCVRKAAHAVGERPSRGPDVVFESRMRTAAAVGAWLVLKRGMAPADAIEMMKQARPGMVTRAEVVRALRKLEGATKREGEGELCGEACACG